MNIEVSVKSILTRPPVVVRALLANCSPTTQVSKRLAEKLGLNAMRDVYVTDDFSGGTAIKWHISLTPIIITVNDLEFPKQRCVYPIINGHNSDAFFEMIIGYDCPGQGEILNRSQDLERGRKLKPSPGPRYQAHVKYLGHNIKMVNLADMASPPDEFFEFLCFDAEAVAALSLTRLAVNKTTNQIAVVFPASHTVYQYDNVPRHLMAALEASASKGEALVAVKDLCPVTTLEAFPPATLTNIEL